MMSELLFFNFFCQKLNLKNHLSPFFFFFSFIEYLITPTMPLGRNRIGVEQDMECGEYKQTWGNRACSHACTVRKDSCRLQAANVSFCILTVVDHVEPGQSLFLSSYFLFIFRLGFCQGGQTHSFNENSLRMHG